MSTHTLETPTASCGPATVLVLGTLISLLIYTLIDVVYQNYFSPFSDIPGPILCRISRLPNCYRLITGVQPFWLCSLHLQYGPIVRTGPHQVSCANPEVWKDVMTYKVNLPGKEQVPHFGRDVAMYVTPPNGVHQIHSVHDDAQHHRIKKTIARAFSEKALREMEPIVTKYVNRLTTRLGEAIDGEEKGKVDLVAWLNYVTFDIIGDLTFGASFGCLQDSTLHPWISTVFDSLRAACFLGALGHFPWAKAAFMALLPPSMKKIQSEHQNASSKKVDERLASGSDRPDFMTLLAAAGKDDSGLSREELHSNATLLVLAGSETTATALAGLIFHLTQNPAIYVKLTTEIRAAFEEDEEITFETTQSLTYMKACIEEGLRLHTPAPTDLTRMAPPEGKMLMGHWMPGGTKISNCMLAIFTNPDLFKDPLEFHPERWLGDERFRGDRLEAAQPFSAGPRGCVGKNLAYAEMRLILAKLLWNFNVELCEQSRNWAREQKIFLLWEKGPLMLNLRKVVR